MHCMIFASDARTVLDVWAMLAASGHSVSATARTADELDGKAARTRPDLVIADLGSGTAPDRVAAVVRMQRAGIPTVALLEERSPLPPDVPVRAVLRKPIHKEYLSLVLARVEEAIRDA